MTRDEMAAHYAGIIDKMGDFVRLAKGIDGHVTALRGSGIELPGLELMAATMNGLAAGWSAAGIDRSSFLAPHASRSRPEHQSD